MKHVFNAIVLAQEEFKNAGNNENVVLSLLEKISKENIPLIKNLNINAPSSSGCFSARGGMFDEKIGKNYTVAFSLSAPFEYIKIDATLKLAHYYSITDKTALPSGISGICLINFIHGIPNLFDALPEYGSNDKGEVRLVYLTTEPIMERIIHFLS
ncbi:MAG: hypothetical protein GQ574_26310 [Crocinitomix sp.]|nr:hypothetical protein [Crocinitomix sp.]